MFDAAPRVGGVIHSEHSAGYVHDWAAHGLLEDAATLALARDLEVPLEAASDAARTRWVWVGGRLRRVPTRPLEALTTDLLSVRAKLRLLAEPFRRGNGAADESVGAFARRRLGGEAARAVVGPLVTGMCAGDPERLSLRAALPRLAALEDKGGLMLGALELLRERRRRGEPLAPPRLLAPVGGLGGLIDALARDLAAQTRTGALVTKVERLKNGRLRVRGDKLGRSAAHPFDAIVLAVDAPAAARILASVAPAAVRALDGITYAPVAVAYLGYRRDQVPHPLDGYGFTVADGEPLRTFGCTFESSLWAGRAPAGQVLLRCELGGVRDPMTVELDEVEIAALAARDLHRALGVSGAPTHARAWRFPRAIAQYELGHRERVRAIEAACEPQGIIVAGSAYRGAGVGGCVADAPRVARAVKARLAALATAALAVAVLACSGGGSSTPRGATPAARDAASDAGRTPGAAMPGASATGTAREAEGSIEVEVVWPKPDAALLRSPGRNRCGAQRPAPLPVAPEGVIADRYATERMVALAGAVVTLSDRDGGDLTAAASAEPVAAELALRECMFHPRVVELAGAGAALALINDDERRHSVRVEHVGDGGAEPALIATAPLAVVGARVELALDRPGIVRVVSEADPDDVAYVVVPGRGRVGVTNDGGAVTFDGLPAGNYRVDVWYPPVVVGGEPVRAGSDVELGGGAGETVRVALGR